MSQFTFFNETYSTFIHQRSTQLTCCSVLLIKEAPVSSSLPPCDLERTPNPTSLAEGYQVKAQRETLYHLVFRPRFLHVCTVR